MAAASGSKNVREIRELQFKDGSSYAGQALEGYTGTLPHGYGCMTTKDGFQVTGLFKDGKSQGEGIFKAPNGDLFYGQWNKNHKRHGKGLSIRASDGVTCVEEYDDGKLLKKVKRRPPAASTLHWLPPLNLPGVDARHTFSGDIPSGHAGHSTTVSRDGGLVVVFGGEERSRDGGIQLTNDVYILDVASRVWVKPATSGTLPPPMQCHTATLVGSRLVVIGGQLGGIEASSSVFVLDIESGVWSCPVAKGLSFMGHTATLIGKEIWVILQSSVFVLSVGSGSGSQGWEWREVATDNRSLPRQVPRSFVNHSAVAVGSMIYVYGGKWLGINHGEGKKYERLSNDLRILHTDRLCWEAPPCSPPPAATSGSAPVVSDFSGFVRGSWDVPRSEHTATLVGNLMYVVGGWTTSNPNMNVVDTCYLNDVQVLNVESLEWQSPTPLPVFIAPRSLHAVVHLQGELWCYGGRNSAVTSLADWNVLHLPQAPPVGADGKPIVKKVAKPAAAPAAAAPAAAPAAAAAVPAASSSAPVFNTSQPGAPAADATSGFISQQDAGSGDILAQFLR